MFSTLFGAFSKQPHVKDFFELKTNLWHTTNAVVLRVFGEIWQNNIEVFQGALARLLHEGKRIVVIDLSGVMFIGSQGISALLGFAKESRAEGIDPRIVAPPSQVRDAIELAHLHRLVEVYETETSAILDRGRELHAGA
jgi:anti-anti-sigma factor